MAVASPGRDASVVKLLNEPDRAARSFETARAMYLVCTAEDLIIQKAVSLREKDWADILGVLTRQSDHLDQAYIMRWLDEFAQALERPELLSRYRALLGSPR
jgi:hypothetical protein